MSEGLITLPAEQYHAMKDVLSNSMLSQFLISPAHLQAYLRNGIDTTPAMELGSLIHTCVLEPECLDKEYVVAPKFDKRTKEGKAGSEAFQAANVGKKMIDQETYERVSKIIESVYSHDAASAFLQSGKPEGCLFWTDEKTGVKCRARLDYYRKDQASLVDVKTTVDARANAFQKSVAVYGYHRQLAFYARGLKANGLPVDRHILIAVEKDDPFGVMVYEMDPTSLIHADAEIDYAFEQYAECLKTGLWPSYTNEIQQLSLPAWAV